MSLIHLSRDEAYLFSYCLIFSPGKEMAQRRRWQTNEEIEIHEEFKWLFNIGDGNEIRILISQLSITMVAIYIGSLRCKTL